MCCLINRHRTLLWVKKHCCFSCYTVSLQPSVWSDPDLQITNNSLSTSNSGSRNRDNDDDCHDDNNNFQLWLQTMSQQLVTNRLDPGFKCPSQIRTEELQRAGDGTTGFLEQHDLWTLVLQLRSWIPIHAWAMVWQKHPALAWGLQMLETFSTPPISAADCAQR